MPYSDDPIEDYDRYDEETNKWLSERPICADCGEHIQEERAYYINGEFLCEDCMSAYLVNVEDYIDHINHME